jgi:DNA-binding CsgD family transcriptional regulator
VTSRNASVLAQVCRSLDGLPLALELAAACTAFLDLDQIADRLDDRFRLLTEGSRVAPSRQRTLQAAVDWSHGLLGPDEQVLLRRLSVFCGGWSLEAAEVVCAGDGLERHRVLPLLRHLVDVSLVVAEEVDGGMRYRLLETIREYAARRLAEAGETAVVGQRHCDRMLTSLRRARESIILTEGLSAQQRLAAVRGLLREEDNYRTALGFCDERGHPRQGLALCSALRAFWYATGQSTEARLWLERFLPAGPPTAEGADAVTAEALYSYAEICFEQGDPVTAAPYAQAGLEAVTAVGDRGLTVHALTLLGQLALLRGDPERAAGLMAEAVRIAHLTGVLYHVGWALHAAAECAEERGRFAEAEQLFRQALSFRQRLNIPFVAATTLRGLGRLAVQRGDPALAADFFDQARTLYEQTGAQAQLIACLTESGRLAVRTGDLSTARNQLRGSLRTARDLGRRGDVANALDGFAELAAAEGAPRRARVLSGAAAGLRRRQGVVDQPGSPPSADDADDADAAEGAAMAIEEAVAFALAPEPGPAVGERGAGRRTVAVAAPPSLLSAREHEVARLLAQGLTNRGVAERLFISPGTVARHVANILAKLGLSSRTQVAVWVAEQPEQPEQG